MRQSIPTFVSLIETTLRLPENVQVLLTDIFRRRRNASFNPGGFFEYPSAGDTPLIRIKAKPRMSIYLETDSVASLLVDAEISYEIGEAISETFITTPPQQLQVTISAEGEALGSAALDVGSSNNEVPVSLARLSPRADPYNLTIEAKLANSTVYSTTTNLSYLAYPDSYGSVARLDQLYGGTYAQRGKNSTWTAIYPYVRLLGPPHKTVNLLPMLAPTDHGLAKIYILRAVEPLLGCQCQHPQRFRRLGI